MKRVFNWLAAGVMAASMFAQALVGPAKAVAPAVAVAAAPAAVAPAVTIAAAPAAVAAPAPAPEHKGKLIFLDPGHGDTDAGSVHETNGQVDLKEKDVNLAIALKLADLLRQNGYDVQMDRTSDTTPVPGGSVAADLQARVDLANRAKADLFISLHNNAAANTAARGTAVYYCADRPFSADSARLAGLVDKGIVANLQQAGYSTADHGPKDDSGAGHFAVLAADNLSRGTQMPGIIGESLYMTNDQDASQLQRPEVQSAIAQGYLDGINAYFAGQ